MSEVVYISLSGLILAALFASAVMWFRQSPALWSQGPRVFAENLVPARPRCRPFWGMAEVFIMFGAMILIGQLAIMGMMARGWLPAPTADGEPVEQTAEQLIASVAASSFAGLCAVGIVLLWMRMIDRDARRKLGLTASAEDVRIGLKASVMLLPPVLILSAVVSYFIPYEHPVLESLADLATPRVFAVIFFGTAIVTPIVEEVLLRGLLQGALQGFADRFSDPEGTSTDWRPQSFWPVVLASFIFSLLHLGQGAAPIPLFLLSLGLGYLYRQTGSLTPSIVVHMVLNSLTLIAEFSKPS
ncbi:MAG: CPBP family intramembrane glutamic endopeptidase [Rubripirellula sp.]